MSFANKSSRMSSTHKNASIKQRNGVFTNSKYSSSKNSDINEKLANGDPVLLSVKRLQFKTEAFKSQTMKKLRKMKNKIRQIEEYQF